MGNTDAKKPGTLMKVSNPPNKNGNGGDWENFGNIFLDPTGHRGTLYLELTVEQLNTLLKSAAEGKVKKKIGIFRSKAKAGAQGGSAPAAPQAAA
jgi:hypothetical protein